jgi:ribonuclease E
MKLLMPSHVRRVQLHSETTPLFQRYGVEDQLSAMYQPMVQLKSGGYLVINPTEALVSIDINSGRSTREHNIEQTAYNTNIEAATEIARQLRLRDMAGLIVIDFIDMEQSGHVRKVEKAMKEALKNDRARIQIGRISSFGLMEMSRQRLRTGVLEASTRPCPHCDGTGLMRTAASAGLSALRMIEDEAARGRGDRITLRAARDAAVYVLNKKRAELADIEQRYGVSIEIVLDESLDGARMSIESSGPRPIPAERPPMVLAEEPEDEEDTEETVDISLEDADEAEEAEPEGERQGRKRRRRRRGGRGRTRREGLPEAVGDEQAEQPEPVDQVEQPAPPEAAAGEASGGKRRRRRGKKPAEAATEVEPDSSPMVERPIDEEPPIAATAAAEQPKPKRRRAKKAEADTAEIALVEPAAADAPPAETADQAAPPAKRPRKRSAKAAPTEAAAGQPKSRAAPADVPAANNDTAAADETGEPRRGWWQRTFG